jgi:cell division protein FtsN
MKNAIRILLYLLLALLVVAIAVIIYKRSKNPEDSMILDLTGQLPSQVGAPVVLDPKQELNGPVQQSMPSESPSNKPITIDYSQPVTKPEPTAAVNSSPKVQKVAEHSTNVKAEKAVITKTSAKTKSVASSSSGFYVVAGSFIVPGHADEQVKKLKKAGYKSASKKVFGSSEYYSAVVGYYNSRNEAQSILNKLQAQGHKAFLKAK